MLNLVNVDSNELIIFKNREGKLKKSNMSIEDIIIRNRLSREGIIDVYNNEGKLVLRIITAVSVNDSISERVLETDDTVCDVLNMNNDKITNIREPTDNLDAARKQYFDDKEIPV
ncbi:hypothetical protein CHS0354_009147, partial [Potamilus streckersoni]